MPGGSSRFASRRQPATAPPHQGSGSGTRDTSIIGRRTMPLSGSAARSRQTSSVRAAQPSTRARGSARNGYQTAAATAELVAAGGSRAINRTR